MTIHHLSREKWIHPEAYGENRFPGVNNDLYRTEAEFDRIEQLVRLNRKEQWQFRVKISCIALAGLIICGIVAQFSRGWF